MIDLYYWPTPNGWKISIALEELNLPYETTLVDITSGANLEPWYLALNPNGKIPTITDRNGDEGPVTIYESGAILTYLADKAGRLLPPAGDARTTVMSWVFWQVGHFGPMIGQLSHFKTYAPESLPYAIERYSKETDRLLGLLDAALGENEYIAGEFSIADIAIWPWLLSAKFLGKPLEERAHILRWHTAMKERPGVRRGVDLYKEVRLFKKPEEQ
ncbi:MAG: glutathione S-transferase N-terminal domain-containing protein [Pseudomonadota bacterium]